MGRTKILPYIALRILVRTLTNIKTLFWPTFAFCMSDFRVAVYLSFRGTQNLHNATITMRDAIQKNFFVNPSQ